jgi:hypothetical protein
MKKEWGSQKEKMIRKLIIDDYGGWQKNLAKNFKEEKVV